MWIIFKSKILGKYSIAGLLDYYETTALSLIYSTKITERYLQTLRLGTSLKPNDYA